LVIYFFEFEVLRALDDLRVPLRERDDEPDLLLRDALLSREPTVVVEFLRRRVVPDEFLPREDVEERPDDDRLPEFPLRDEFVREFPERDELFPLFPERDDPLLRELLSLREEFLYCEEPMYLLWFTEPDPLRPFIPERPFLSL
jgi:hypothetical protein